MLSQLDSCQKLHFFVSVIDFPLDNAISSYGFVYTSPPEAHEKPETDEPIIERHIRDDSLLTSVHSFIARSEKKP